MIQESVIRECVNEYEKRFRSRTPPKTIQDVLPDSRVLKTEIREWALKEGLIRKHQQSELLICKEFYESIEKKLHQLKKEK